MESPTITISVIFYCTILVVWLNHQSDARDTITTNNPLRDDDRGGEILVSAGRRFELGFFTPDPEVKNRYVGIWFHNRSSRVVWVANRDNPVSGSSGSFAIAEDGNLKVFSNGNIACANITVLVKNVGFNRTVKLLDNGNLIIFDGPSPSPSVKKYLWQSFHSPTDTFLPGMEMDDDMGLTSWSLPTDPAIGDYSFRKSREFYKILKGSELYWISAEPDISFIPRRMPYPVADLLSGPKESLDESEYQSSATQNNSGITYNFSRLSRNNVSHLFMNSTGKIQYYGWDDREGWTLLWYEPQDDCSVDYNACGKFSTCDSNSESRCKCLPGFQSVSVEDSSPVDCESRKQITCDGTADKIEESKFLNLWSTHFSGKFETSYKALNEEKCKEECLNDCNCKAYYYKLKANATQREASDVDMALPQVDHKCFIGTELKNLQVDGEGGFQLHVRVNLSDMDLKARDCRPCGITMIPYPLSTGPNCGDPSYSSFYCDNSTSKLQFQTLSGKYKVISINKENRTFEIEVDSEIANSCDSRNFSRQVVKLNQSSPFNVKNWCYKRRIEISWNPPQEPSCNGSGDCQDWPNSSCYARANVERRCHCNQDYKWDDTSVNCVQARSGKSQRTFVIIIIAVFAAVLLVCCFSYYFYRTKGMTERKGSGENSGENPMLWQYERSDRQVSDLMDEENKSGVDVPFWSWESIIAATENFSDVHKLGRGGFGPVYKGMFPGGQEIAVKRLSSYSVQGINEFRNEVVLIAKLQHRNLVRLLGYCVKGNEKILLYEYMPNKSLDAFIFDKKLYMLLNWKKRFDIILGIARGVLYLHQDSRLRIIHRDLKTSNILLDEEMNPKISDFGLARIVEGKGTEASTNKVVGTYGYMSPEYALDGLFSIKSDVFSFGVVVLEIISGRRNTGFYHSKEALNLLGYAWGLWSENKAFDLMDPILLESCEKSEVMKCINVGLLCVQEDPSDRPTMSNVVFMLSEATVLPVPNQPAFVMRKRIFSTSSSSSTQPGSISNELTMSVAEGR